MFLKILSFDIEVSTVENRMPSPDKDRVLLISNHFNYDIIIDNFKTRNIMLLLHKNKEEVFTYNDKIVYIYNDEIKLINKFFSLVNQNDIITGYNIGNFDFPYLIDRARELGVKNINIGNGDSKLYYRKSLSKGFSITKIGGTTGKILIDVLGVFRREDATNIFLKKHNLKNLTLRHVSKEILGIEKLEFSIEEMNRYWNDCDNIELRNRFIDYCSRDSELALMFLTKYRLLDKFISLSRASGKLVQEVINSQGSGIMVENLLLKEFGKNDRLMPVRIGSESGSESNSEELSGAFVLEPKLGVTDNCGSLDYTSLYPTLMIKHNLSYDTLVLNGDLSKIGLTEDDVEHQYDEMGYKYATFVKKEKYKGIVPSKLENFLTLRASLKKDMKKFDKGTPEYLILDSTQEAIKILLNSHYGYSGDASAKVYSWFIASAVTTNGRIRIKKTIEMINRLEIKKDNVEYILKVIMSDTDSTYVNVIKVVNGIVEKDVSRDDVVYAVNYAADSVNEILEKPMKLAYENYIKRILIIAKKHYGMLVIDDSIKETVKTKGLETVRRDWCEYSSNNMGKIIDFILKEKDVSEGVKKSINLIREQVKLLKEDKIDINDLVMSKKLTKLITEYDNKAIHCQVAIKMKERGKPSQVGDRIQYLVIDNGKKLIGERAEEADYVIKNLDKFKIDKDYYINHQLLPPALRVLELLGVSKDVLVVKMDEKQSLLDKWF